MAKEPRTTTAHADRKAAIEHLLALRSARGRSARVAARDAFADFLLRLDVLRFAAIERWLRPTPSIEMRHWQARLTALVSLPACDAWPEFDLVLESFDRDGRVRESAVAALIARADRSDHHPRTLAAVLLRTNDWALPVRRVADRYVAAAMRDAPLVTLLDALPLFHRLTALGRDDHSRTLELLRRRFDAQDGVAALVEALEQPSQATRRVARFVLLDLPSCPWDRVIEQAMGDVDVMARLRAIEHAERHLDGGAYRECLLRAMDDATPFVRTTALRRLVESGDSRLAEVLERTLFDRSRAVRRVAIYHVVRNAPDRDLGGDYRAVVRDGHLATRRAAILGLADIPSRCTDRAADVAALRDVLESDDGALVASALDSLVRIDPDKARAVLVPFASDRRSIVVNAATRRLVAYVRADDEPWIVRELTTSRDEARLVALLRLVRALPWFARLTRILEVDPTIGERVAAKARSELAVWTRDLSRFPRRVDPPDDASLALIREALVRRRAHLGAATVDAASEVLRVATL